MDCPKEVKEKIVSTLKEDPYKIESMVDELEPWIPELKASLLCEQNTQWHYCNVLHHSLRAVKELREFDETLALVLLFHDLGKPYVKVTDDKGIDHFKHHPEKSAEIAKRICDDLELSEYQKNIIPILVLNHENWLYPRLDTVYNLRIEMGWDDKMVRQLLEVRRCDMLAHSTLGQRTYIQIFAFRDLYEKCVLNRPMEISDLNITKEDILENTQCKEDEVDELLSKCLTYCFYEPYKNKKEKLLNYIQNAS